jgi:hypothetical protein
VLLWTSDQYSATDTRQDVTVDIPGGLVLDPGDYLVYIYAGPGWNPLNVWGASVNNAHLIVSGSLPFGFDAEVGIVAINAGGGNGQLDTLALVPADEFVLLADTAHAAGEGLMIDAMDPDEVTVYGTDTSGGIEPADQEDAEYSGAPQIWPGETAIVYDAHTPAAAIPTAGDAKLWYKPTYRTPYGA